MTTRCEHVYRVTDRRLVDAEPQDIKAAARTIRKVGSDLRSTYNGAVREWSDMGKHYSSPDTASVTNAFPDHMDQYVTAVEQVTTKVANATNIYADTLIDLQPTMQTLNGAIEAHNDHGYPVPENHPDVAADLNRRRNDLLTAVDEAETAVDNANLAITVAGDTTPGQVNNIGQMVVGFVKAWTDRADGFDLESAANVSKGRHVDPEQFVLMFRAMDVNSFPSLGNQIKKIVTPKLWNDIQSLIKTDTPKTKVTAVNIPLGPVESGSWAEKLGKLPETDGFKNFSSALDKVGKAATVVDTVFTYADSYSDNYNESVQERPGWSAQQHAQEAATSAAIEGSAETVGKVAGTAAGQAVGRVGGAALGQALIPIPGVGAAVGSVVGGFVGSWVGEKIGGGIGKAVGDELNEWRKNADIGSVGDVVGAAKDGLVEGGKSVVKGIGGFFGFGG